MPSEDQTCFVFVQLPKTFEWAVCGVLTVSTLGSNLYRGVFRYGRSYLARKSAVSLDPFNLPLSEQPQEITKLKGIPGVLRDASPDAWGRRVIQAKLGLPQTQISEVDYLLNGPDDGAGNLRFATAPTLQPTGRAFNRTHHLQALIAAAQELEESGKLVHEVLEQLEPGTSLGGARPKVTVEHDHRIWLAKLPEKSDRLNMQRIEYATLELARFAGLNVCAARLERTANQDVLMLERFDRQWNIDLGMYERFGLVSGLTVLDAEEGYLGRDRWSYLLLADELRRWSSNPKEDQRELFRRMVFNAMVTNNDDHPRNHALLSVEGGWRLSPAYDIVPVPLVSLEHRDLALEVGSHGRVASVYNLLSQSAVFGLSVQDASDEIARMREKVACWQTVFKQHGVSEKDIVAIAPAILAPCFERTEPADPV
jgi:serine/threonine-protein kinase HipA